jgi:Protein of unknown function (DUF2950)
VAFTEAAVVTAGAVTGKPTFTSTKELCDTENEIMRTTNLKSTISAGRLSSIAVLACSLLVIGYASSSRAQTSHPRTRHAKTFASAADAAAALFQAVQNEDEPAIEAILGCAREVASSDDVVEDKLEREQFREKYQEMHRLVREPDGKTVLYIGAENWPFPIPLVSKSGAWYFDSDTGKQEIEFRRIGENEATAIQVCEEFAMAKSQDGVKAASEDPITQFAENLVSAGAANTDNSGSNLFHGYYFRVVRQNSVAGASSNKARGLTLIAYPAEYRGSGVMTFVVTHHGIVHEKDLGRSTATVAPRIKSGTGPSWRLTA